MEFKKEVFEEALRDNNIVRYKAMFAGVVRSYIKIYKEREKI